MAGLLATAVMSLFTETASAAGLTKMPPLALVYGTLFSGDREKAMRIGSGIHFLLLGAVALGLAYASALSLLDVTSWLFVVGLGIVNGVVFGVSLGWLHAFHPRILSTSPEHPEIKGRNVAAGDIGVLDPGIFGVNWGDLTPVVIVTSFVIYSLVFTAAYRWLA